MGEDIKKAEEALFELQRDLMRAQEVSKTGNWRVKVNGELFWSVEVYRIFEVPFQKALTYEVFLSLVHPNDRKFVDDSWQAALKGERYDIEHRIIANGKVKWVRETAELEFKDGELLGGFGTVQDITERKQAEAELKRQLSIRQARNQILEQALSVQSEEALGKVCLSVAEEITGSKIGFIGELKESTMDFIAISNLSWHAFMTANGNGYREVPKNLRVVGLYGKVLKEGRSFYSNNPTNHPERSGLPTGHPSLVSFLGVPLINRGKIDGMIAVANREGGYTQTELDSLESLSPVIVEAFERKRAEEALKESEELFSKAFHSNPSVLTITRVSDNRLVDVNEAFLSLFGFARKEVVGRTSKELDLFQDYASREKIVSEALKRGSVRNIELLVRTKTGKIRRTLASTEIISLHGEKHLLVALLDMTKQKLMEEKIQAYTKDLEGLVEQRTKQLKDSERLAAIGATAGMVGHDIRNPLQAMMSDVYLLKDELTSMPECKTKHNVAESLDGIEKCICYINKIVADLQDYAKQVNPEFKEANLYDLVVDLFAPINLPDEIICSLEIDRSLWLKTDKTLITRILTNLIINAIQAMPNGGNLTVNASKNNRKVTISVEDTGVGIPEHVKPKLFTPMMTTKAKGQGLGLAVVKRFVEALNGTITFESEVGKGTKFKLEVPE